MLEMRSYPAALTVEEQEEKGLEGEKKKGTLGSLPQKTAAASGPKMLQRNKQHLNFLLILRSAEIPNKAIESTCFYVHRVDRTKDLSGKSKGGGVCFMINNAWCNQKNVHFIESFCSTDLEYLILCRPLWLPREISGLPVTIVYPTTG
ncbi:hypothetical protein MHYP_G00082130 [Metynnis hypsauchen]